MTIGITPTEIDINITKSSDLVLNFTCTDSVGDPFEITDYEFYFVAREEKNVESTLAIEILNADIIKSDSGSGTTDTFTIDLTNSLLGICQRIYFYEVRSKLTGSGDNDIWFNGNLDIKWTVQEAR